MVAASSDSSNVPPDHLEAAPVLAFATIAADGFRIGSHIRGIDTQPRAARQNHTPRAQPGRLPGTVAALALDVTACGDAQAAAAGITPQQCVPLIATQAEPCRGKHSLQLDGNGQQGHETETGQAQHCTDQQHEAAQSRIRRDLGRV